MLATQGLVLATATKAQVGQKLNEQPGNQQTNEQATHDAETNDVANTVTPDACLK